MSTEHATPDSLLAFLDELAPQSSAYYDALLRLLDAASAASPELLSPAVVQAIIKDYPLP